MIDKDLLLAQKFSKEGWIPFLGYFKIYKGDNFMGSLFGVDNGSVLKIELFEYTDNDLCHILVDIPLADLPGPEVIVFKPAVTFHQLWDKLDAVVAAIEYTIVQQEIDKIVEELISIKGEEIKVSQSNTSITFYLPDALKIKRQDVIDALYKKRDVHFLWSTVKFALEVLNDDILE